MGFVLRLDNKSRMSREVPVRFREGLGVKSPRATRLTISGGDELARRLGYVMARLRHITSDEGFTINEKKTRVQRRHQAQGVTGLVVNDKVSVSRKELRRLRSILHHAAKDGLESQNRLQHRNFRGYMTGMIAYVSAIRPDLAREMKNQLDQVSA
jgi:RNA-directed DNA polymerase